MLNIKNVFRNSLSILGVLGLGVITGCAMGQSGRYVRAEAWGANYTEDYIPEFHILTTSGEDTGAEETQIKPFSEGGTGGHECCSPIPGVGQSIKVVWYVGTHQNVRSQWKTYSQDIIVRGSTSTNKDDMNVLIVRFFPGYNIEAEFLYESGRPDEKTNPRVDRIFYGERVMRKMGE